MTGQSPFSNPDASADAVEELGEGVGGGRCAEPSLGRDTVLGSWDQGPKQTPQSPQQRKKGRV